MNEVTTAKFPRKVLERLKTYGLKGQSYADIVTRLMEQVDREAFIAEQFRIHDAATKEGDRLRRVGKP